MVPDMTPDDAWANIKRAVVERDIDEVKSAVQIYVKANPEVTYHTLEHAFRKEGINLFLVALEKPLAAAFTNMDLQGNLGKKYTVTYRLQWAPPRQVDREAWPKDYDENLERLKNAGEVVEVFLPRCGNCGELGHISKSCPQEKVEKTVLDIKCYNCDQIGHRMRDCESSLF
ncbi:hypothetical protein VTK56DRAFT_6579 [Thermocarpiscus australiensis]